MSALIEITTRPADQPVATEPLFSIDGVTYSIPQEISGNIALGVLHRARELGEGLALSWMLEEVLGTEAYTALLNCHDVTPAQMKAIMTVVRTKVMGVMEATQGE